MQKFKAIAAVLGVVVALVGCNTRQAATTPAAKFIDSYTERLAADFEKAGQAVYVGEIKTDVELLEFLQKATEESRKGAAVELNKFLEEKLSDGNLKEADATVLKTVSLQFRGAKHGR